MTQRQQEPGWEFRRCRHLCPWFSSQKPGFLLPSSQCPTSCSSGCQRCSPHPSRQVPPAADASQTPKSNLTARDESLSNVSLEGRNFYREVTDISNSPQLSDFCFCCSTHCYFQQEGSGCWLSRDSTEKVRHLCVISSPYSPVRRRAQAQGEHPSPASPDNMCRCDPPPSRSPASFLTMGVGMD